MEPRAIRASNAPSFELGAFSVTAMVSGKDTAGTLAILETPMAPHVLAGPLHTNNNEDALWYVIEGEIGAQVGDKVFREGAGAVVFAPKGVPHTYWNPGEVAAKYLEVVWPAGLEHFVAGLSHVIEDGDDPREGVARIAAAFGIDLDWDSLPVLIERHGVGFDQGSS